MSLFVFNIFITLVLIAIPIIVPWIIYKFQFQYEDGSDAKIGFAAISLIVYSFLILWAWYANDGHERKADSYGVIPTKVYTICDTGYTDKCIQVAIVEGKLINVSKELGIYVPDGYGLTTIEYKRSWSALTYKDYPTIYWVQKVTENTPQGSHGDKHEN